MSNILSIGKSALAAAQVGIDVTGHNIANASTVGYSREVVIKGAVAGQDMGFGYVGKGTQILDIRRVYNEFSSSQVRSAQTSYSQLDTYYTQISQINNMLADSTVGLTPSLQDFFSSIQDVATTPSSTVARQSMLSSGEALVSQFQSLSQQLTEISDGINTQITASTTSINSYAKQLAQLNDAIEQAMGRTENTAAPNDLLDQRDQLLADLSKEVRVSLVKQGNTYDVYIGNGQPLVVGSTSYGLVNVTSSTDPSRIEVAYKNANGTTSVLSNNTLSGGSLTGLLNFRSEVLDVAQNSLGRIATVLASTVNAQHALGVDLSGTAGGAFFNVGQPVVAADGSITGATGAATASIVDATKLTTSDYKLSFSGGTTYTLTRLSDNTVLSSTDLAAAHTAAAAEGFDFNITTAMSVTGENFVIRPTVNGASGISMAITDASKIAAAAPILASATSSNTGTGKITSGTATSLPINAAATLTYNGGNLSGFPATEAVTVTSGGTSTTYPAGTASIPYTNGATISYGGISLVISGTPANGDTFTVAANTSGVGDNRNALLLGALQTSKLVAGSTATYQSAYSQLVNMIGNKTSELEVTSTSAKTLYTNAYNTQQSESGVNLDEEAANLLRYQQEYQAAAKVMQIASTLFDSLLAIGR